MVTGVHLDEVVPESCGGKHEDGGQQRGHVHLDILHRKYMSEFGRIVRIRFHIYFATFNFLILRGTYSTISLLSVFHITGNKQIYIFFKA